jgi:hypothetical protein
MSKAKKISKKPKSAKPVKTPDPFEAGLDAEQFLADTLCDQFLQVGVEQEAIDKAFVGAFTGLTHRMLTIFGKDFVFSLVEDTAHDGKNHVCDSCKSEGLEVPVKPAPYKGSLH